MRDFKKGEIKMIEPLERTDWKLLQTQKEDLVYLLSKIHKGMGSVLVKETEAKSLEGILNWIDSIQDFMVDTEKLSSAEVFG